MDELVQAPDGHHNIPNVRVDQDLGQDVHENNNWLGGDDFRSDIDALRNSSESSSISKSSLPPDIPNTIHHNPPVTIEDWPETLLDEPDDFEANSLDNTPTNSDLESLDQDSPFIEQMAPPTLDPDRETELNDQELRELLEEHLGTLDEDEWYELYCRVLGTKDINTLKFLASRLRTHFSRTTYEDLRNNVCKSLQIPSKFIAWRHLRILSGLETRAYDCCIKSCICYLGKYKDRTSCQHCGEERFNRNGKPRQVFHYTPLIPQLRALFQNTTMVKKLHYRTTVESKHKPGVIQDVFDGEHYRKLRATQLSPDSSYHFFDNPEDIALSLSTDGFTLFKWRRWGLSTAWPIILINNNLSPKIRTRLENVICIGMIPGPSQCKDLNSFLIPLIEELLGLEQGVPSTGVSPEGQIAEWDCNDLPMRTHALFLEHTEKILAARTKKKRNELAKHYGINALSVFSRLRSFDLASCAPYDIMHLFFENLVPNLILHWTGNFKQLDQGIGNYQLSETAWKTIGEETAGSVSMIPTDFVGTLPDIAQDGSLYKAEAYAFWIQYIAPIVLKDRLPAQYYQHTLLLCEIIMTCLEFLVTSNKIDQLDTMVKKWVMQYEEYYYQYDTARLPACPLTIHAILHIPFYLRQTGPLWASWAFVMERFCGHLVPAVKNRIRPYDHLDNYVQRHAQMQIVSVVYNLPVLSHTPAAKHHTEGGVEISSRETIYPEFPLLVLGAPVTKFAKAKKKLIKWFTQYFSMVYGLQDARYLRSRIDRKSVIRYGRLRMAGDGDQFRTANLITRDPNAQDNSFVRYALLPNANAAFRNRPDIPYRENQYGRLLDIYHVIYIEDDGTRKVYLLAFIQPCNTNGLDATLLESPVVTYDLRQVKQGENTWAIVDRSRGGVRAEFVDDECNEPN
ncbi:hypothetical protein CTheo_8568 [Ceratobasidium theobromae]|uniref:Transposase family Tnp2 protein n=1 Tax=Ceratobasidium theobromae TaxID=1582974 RepID=A0A5N5Q991_9AGAM|nr:hypothetical protein CTheo_8568 [Ceratobasidium theobromae]